MMRKAAISLAFSMTLAGPALAQTNPVPIPAARPAPQAARPAIHPVSKSADPTFDEGTYQRISAAMLSYSSIEVRGGWPMLPAVNFTSMCRPGRPEKSTTTRESASSSGT